MFARTKEEEIEQVQGALPALMTVEPKPCTERQVFGADVEETPGAVTLLGLFIWPVDSRLSEGLNPVSNDVPGLRKRR